MNREQYKIIDNYISGRLPKEERLRFEEALKSDPELRNQVKVCTEFQEAILERDEINELRAELSNIHQSVKGHRARTIHWACGAVAAVAVILIALPFITFKQIESNTDKLFNKHFSSYTYTWETRNNLTSEDELPSNILTLFCKREYSSATPLLKSFVEENPQHNEAIIMLALAYMSEGASTEAIKLLNSSIEQLRLSIYAEHADWYLGLALLQQGDETEAKEIFRTIAEQDGFFASRAEEITND